MIHVIEKLKLNKFREVHCICPKDLYSRLGHKIQPNVQFESSDEVVPMNMNKLDSIEYLQRYDEQMQSEYNQRESAGTDATSKGNDNSDSNE